VGSIVWEAHHPHTDLVRPDEEQQQQQRVVHDGAVRVEVQAVPYRDPEVEREESARRARDGARGRPEGRRREGGRLQGSVRRS